MLVAIASDLHTNSTVALCPPRVQLDDGGEYVASQPQRWIWRQWLAFWNEIAEKRAAIGGPLFVILNGELADDNHHHTTQLVTRNPADQLKLALLCLKPVTDLLRDGDRLFVTRGTEAHSGVSSHMDETLARELGAENCSESARNGGKDADLTFSLQNLRIEVQGVRFDVAHHPPGGGGRVPWTRANFAPRLAAQTFYEACERGEKPPHLLVRGHVHRPGDSYDAAPVRALILPSWQLSTAYGYRIGGGTLPVGGAYIICSGRGAYEVHKRYSAWPIQSYWKEPATTPG